MSENLSQQQPNERQSNNVTGEAFDSNANNAVTAELSEKDQQFHEIIRGLSYCGHYLHFHSGGRGGRGPILCLLAKHNGHMSQQKLGTYFELKPGSLSEILAKIETAGFIERSRDPEDRRQLFIHLTESGMAEAEREQKHRELFKEQAFSNLDADELVQLDNLLKKIRTRWEELAC